MYCHGCGRALPTDDDGRIDRQRVHTSPAGVFCDGCFRGDQADYRGQQSIRDMADKIEAQRGDNDES